MEVPPRPKERQIMPRRLMTWLVIVGFVMAGGTLGVLAWGDAAFGDVIARTMGMTTFALFRLFSSLETADEDASLFSGTILGNRPLLIGTGISVLSIVLATELPFLQRLLGTTSLTAEQWFVCIGVSLSLMFARTTTSISPGSRPASRAMLRMFSVISFIAATGRNTGFHPLDTRAVRRKAPGVKAPK